MYCSNCGKKLSEDDFFCSNCGTPVLRQDLFNDSNDEYSNDAFEETRLFTAEELGQFLNDPTEESAPIEEDVYQPAYQNNNNFQQSTQEGYVETPYADSSVVKQPDQESSTKKTVDAKEMVSGALGSANAFVGKFKSRRSEAKAKKAEKKQSAVIDEEVTSESSIKETTEGPVPFKKIVFPVVVLGLIIGLVFGLILVQPWNNDNDTENTATGSIMITESFNKM